MRYIFYLLLVFSISPALPALAKESAEAANIVGYMEYYGVGRQIAHSPVFTISATNCRFVTNNPKAAITSGLHRVYLSEIQKIVGHYRGNSGFRLGTTFYTNSGKTISWKGEGEGRNDLTAMGHIRLSRGEPSADCREYDEKKALIYVHKGSKLPPAVIAISYARITSSNPRIKRANITVEVNDIIRLDLTDRQRGLELYASLERKVEKYKKIIAARAAQNAAEKEKMAAAQHETVQGPIKIVRLKPNAASIQSHMKSVLGAVVTVILPDATGSGFYIDANGYVITNRHVVRQYKDVVLKLYSGGLVQGRVIRTSKTPDIALIKTRPMRLDALPIRPSKIEVGEDVYAIGSPEGLAHDATVSRGIVSAYRGTGDSRLIQSDVNTLKGSSGGPLLDKNGNVVALTVAGYKEGFGLNYFIPIKLGMKALALTTK